LHEGILPTILIIATLDFTTLGNSTEMQADVKADRILSVVGGAWK
jgi:hypothetical protein